MISIISILIRRGRNFHLEEEFFINSQIEEGRKSSLTRKLRNMRHFWEEM